MVNYQSTNNVNKSVFLTFANYNDKSPQQILIGIGGNVMNVMHLHCEINTEK